MVLTLGSHVREHGHRAGRLVGFELEPATARITRIIFSRDGNLGSQAVTRPLSAVELTAAGVEVRSDAGSAPPAVESDVVLLSRSTRITRDGSDRGRLVGIVVDPASHRMLSISGRQHWFTGKFTAHTPNLDCSQPGEIRISGQSHDTRAA
jgi:hypothetical protein